MINIYVGAFYFVERLQLPFFLQKAEILYVHITDISLS